MERIILIYHIFIFVIPFAVFGYDNSIVHYFLILLVLTAFELGYLFSAKNLSNISQKNRATDPGFEVSPNVLCLFILLFIFFRFEMVVTAISSVANGNYFDLALQNAVVRYQGFSENPTILYQLGTVVFFVYPSLIPWLKNSTQFRMRWLFYVGLVFFWFVETTTLGRAGVLLSFFCFLVELLIKNNDKIKHFSTSKLFFILALIILGMLFIFSISGYYRLTDNDREDGKLFEKFQQYVICVYPALTVWLEGHELSILPQGYGFETFTGLFKVLGSTTVQGTYALVDTKYGPTNVFTIYRGIIYDLGIVNAIFVMFIVGQAVKKFAETKLTISSYMFVRSVYIIILYAIISPFTFTTFLISAVVSPLILNLSLSVTIRDRK